MCGAVATFAVGEINLFRFVRIVLAHQSGVGATQTSRWKSTTFKGSIVVVAPGPSKFCKNARPSNITNAGGTDGASSAVPIFRVSGSIVEVMYIVAVLWFDTTGIEARRFALEILCVTSWTCNTFGAWNEILWLKELFITINTICRCYCVAINKTRLKKRKQKMEKKKGQ